MKQAPEDCQILIFITTLIYNISHVRLKYLHLWSMGKNKKNKEENDIVKKAEEDEESM